MDAPRPADAAEASETKSATAPPCLGFPSWRGRKKKQRGGKNLGLHKGEMGLGQWGQTGDAWEENPIRVRRGTQTHTHTQRTGEGGEILKRGAAFSAAQGKATVHGFFHPRPALTCLLCSANYIPAGWWCCRGVSARAQDIGQRGHIAVRWYCLESCRNLGEKSKRLCKFQDDLNRSIVSTREDSRITWLQKLGYQDNLVAKARIETTKSICDIAIVHTLDLEARSMKLAK